MSLSEWLRRLSRSARSDDMELGLNSEIEFHIEQQTAKYIAAGMAPGEARRAALRRFGGVDLMKENARDEARPRLLEDAWRDTRYGVRTLLRSRSFSLVAILTLGLGIGGATAVFSVVHGVLLKPLPYPEEDRLVRLMQVNAEGNPAQVSGPNFDDWQTQTRSFENMARMSVFGEATVRAFGDAHRARRSSVSREFFDVIQVTPALGRGFSPDDHREGAVPVVLVGDGYWKRDLGSRRLEDITLSIDDVVYRVIGVMPPEFDYPGNADMWMPIELNGPSTSRTAHNYAVVARLADDVTLTGARTDLSSLSRALKQKYGDETWMFDAAVIPLREQLTQTAKPVLLVLFGAAAFLLLIACANVSNLLLARAATRRREVAVRLAMGAGRGALVRQMMTESLMLCLAGGAVGILIAQLGVDALLRYDAGSLPRAEEIGVSWMALLFAVGVALATAILLGLATSARTGQKDLRNVLVEDGRTVSAGGRSQRVRDGLVVAQIATTIVLLAAAGVLTRSFVALLNVDVGFDTSNALIIDMDLPQSQDPAAPQRQIALQTAIMDRLRLLPGVEHVGLVNAFPLGGTGNYADGMFLEMNSADEIQSYEQFQQMDPSAVKERAGEASFRVASDDYFEAMGIPLISGRFFGPGDAIDAPHVAIISDSLAKLKWPGRDPIGRFIQFGNMDGDLRGFRVVGVVGDVRETGPEAIPTPMFYASSRQRPARVSGFSIVVRGPDPAAISADAQQAVRQVDPQLPMIVRTMDQAMDDTFAGRRFSLLIIGAFSAAALVLATLGLYGVIAYLVAQRTREIGIRTVLGAPISNVLRLVIGKGARLAALGGIIGIAAVFALGRVLESMVFGAVRPTDAASLLTVLAVIAASVTVASLVPARRALRVSPMVALRAD